MDLYSRKHQTDSQSCIFGLFLFSANTSFSSWFFVYTRQKKTFSIWVILLSGQIYLREGRKQAALRPRDFQGYTLYNIYATYYTY